MKTHTRSLVSFSLLLSLALSVLPSGGAVAQRRRGAVGGPGPDALRDWPQPQVHEGLTPDQIVSAITEYAQQLVDTDRFSGVVLVAKDGQTRLSHAWGTANAAEKNTPDTKFNIGSINKSFTSKAVQQLADAGTLTLDDPVHKHLPDYPSPIADRITIRQLLEHRSGLGDIFGPKYFNAPPSRLRELSDFLPLFVDEPLQFEPGTSQRYSNAGYVVLGLIIERISGEKYRDYVRKHIFEPAGMKDTGFWAVDEPVAHRATGYTLRGPNGPLSARAPNDASLPGRPSSAGGAYATAADLLRFFQWSNADRLGVAGGAPGVNAAVEIENGWTVIVMANYDPPAAQGLARGAMAIIRGRRDAEPGGAAGMKRPPSAPAKTDMTGAVAVPLAPVEHLLAVEARVDGKGPYRFVIDSGAAGLMRVSPELAKTLGLEQIGVARSGDPSGKNMIEVPIVRVGSVEVGGVRFSGIEASVSTRPGPPQRDGVIGLGLFAGLTVTLDYAKQELRLSREPLPAGGAHVIAFTSERGVPQIEISAGAVALRADVDTGSPALLSVPPSAGVPLRGASRVVGKGRTSTNELDIRAADLNGALLIAGWSHTNPTIDIVDHFPVVNVGSRFLRQYVVTFDMPNKRLALTK